MRTGEVFALTWDDIDFKNNVINIDKIVFAIDKSKNGRWYIGTTKYYYIIIITNSNLSHVNKIVILLTC